MPEPIRVDVAIVPTATRVEREQAQLDAALARAALGADEQAAATWQGQAMSDEQAVAEALEV